MKVKDIPEEKIEKKKRKGSNINHPKDKKGK